MSALWTVYKHTSNITSKSYIGLTKYTVNKRWKEHVKEAKGKCRYHFHKAIRKYGTEEWQHEILDTNITTLDQANMLEAHYVAKYDTFNNGYNLTLGGDGAPGCIDTEEKRIAREARLPVYKFMHFEYGIEEMSLKLMSKKYGMSKGNLSMVTSGQRTNVAGWQLYSSQGPENFDKSKEIVVLYHHEYGEETGTTKYIANKYGIPNGKLREMAIYRKTAIAHGWALNKDTTKESIIQSVANKKLKIRKFIHDDGTIRECSAKELCKEYDLSSGTLSMVIKGKRSYHKGWKIMQSQKIVGNMGAS